MGFPESFIIPVSDNQAYRQFGNAVVPPVVEAVAQEIIKSLRNPILNDLTDLDKFMQLELALNLS
jgi:DNA (cytosine-5)-methyltransferase 1